MDIALETRPTVTSDDAARCLDLLAEVDADQERQREEIRRNVTANVATIQARGRRELAAPKISDGTPPHWRLRISLCVRRETAAAWLVELCDEPGGQAWLPKSKVTTSLDRNCSSVYRAAPAGERCHFDVFTFSIPAWLYLKVRPQLVK